MLDGTWACFERQNTCHFVDCHSCTRSEVGKEANGARLSFPSRFVVCSSRRRGNHMLQQDRRNDATEIRWKSLCIKAELTSQLMAAGCPRHRSQNVVSCYRLCRHCLLPPPRPPPSILRLSLSLFSKGNKWNLIWFRRTLWVYAETSNWIKLFFYSLRLFHYPAFVLHSLPLRNSFSSRRKSKFSAVISTRNLIHWLFNRIRNDCAIDQWETLTI